MAGWWGLLATATFANLIAAETTATPADRLEAAHREAQRAYLASANQPALACRLARLTFDLAETPIPTRRREELALEGIAACQSALAQHPDHPAAHYYLGMNLGQLARVRPLSALRLVGKMRAAFEKARQLKEGFDHAGPDRNLGLLYREAPGWPASIGDRTRARRHLRRAVELDPEHPENRLNLAESGLLWKEPDLVWPQVAALEKLWPEARRRLTGTAWESAWTDWDQRWTNLLTGAQSLPRR